MSRPTKDRWGLNLADVVSTRATCLRRSVGCVLVDARGRVLATGFNGVAAGLPHCSEGHPCAGASCPSGTGLDLCEAIHAEANALLQCRDVDAITTAYVTVSPCVTCTKLLLSTGCQRIVASKPYAHDQAARQLWERAGRRWLNSLTMVEA